MTASTRSFTAKAKGTDIDSLEMNALDQARDLFGQEVKLTFSRTYTVSRRSDGVYEAFIVVREG